jgi:predicted porin
MKKSLLALAVASAFSGAAFAQSSVTLFGIVDLSLRSVSASDNGGRVTGLADSGLNSTRLGFRGVEDLGGGLQAGFWLEAGNFAFDNGTDRGPSNTNNQASGANAAGSGITFQRRSTVSLMGGFGEIRLGRDYTPDFWNLTVFDPFGTNGVGSNLMAGSSSGTGIAHFTAVRASNSVGYFLPSNLGGVYGQVQYAFGENNSNAANDKDGTYTGFRVGYRGGPVNAAFGYGQTKYDPTATTTGDVTRYNAGAELTFGMFAPTFLYNHVEADSVVGGTTDPERDDIELGLKVTVGAGLIRAAVSRYDAKNSANASSEGKHYAVGYVHNLSKRTALYGTVARADNSGSATAFAIGTGLASGVTVAPGGSTTGFEVGVSHSF